MKCVVLAAGYATRLYPLTKTFPKPLLMVGGKTILDWLLDDVDKTRLPNDYIIVSNHVYCGHFCEWAARKELCAPISVLDDGSVSNETRLGAVNDMLLAIDEKGISEDMLVLAGDNVLDFSLSHFIDYAKDKSGSCAMRYFEKDVQRLRRAGVVETDSMDRMIKMTEKPDEPASNWCVPPFYYYKERDLNALRDCRAGGCSMDAPGSALAYLGERSEVYVMEMPGKRYDIGTLKTYEEVCYNYKGIIV